MFYIHLVLQKHCMLSVAIMCVTMLEEANIVTGQP